jgi:chemotaxis protein histidine kinase CheA
MDYLTNHYKFKAEQLQERYEFLQYELKMLTEWSENMSDADVEAWVKQTAQNPEQANALRELIKKRRARRQADNRNASKAESSSAPKTETPKAETPKAPNSGPTPPPRRDPYAESNAEARRKADERARTSAAEAEAKAAKGEPAKPASEVKAKKPAGPNKFTTFVKGQFPTPVKNYPSALGKEIKDTAKTIFTPRGFGGFAGGLGAAYGADKALEAAGIENEWIRQAGSWGAGAAGDVAATAILAGSLPTIGGLGAAAAAGAVLGVGSLGGYKAGEAIMDLEHPFQGEGKHATISDALGKGIYYAARSPFNWIAGNATGAGTSDLNEKPKGVAGGDPAILARNAAADEEEKQKAKERAQWIANRAKQLQGQSNGA